jgi:hypothetical protein
LATFVLIAAGVKKKTQNQIKMPKAFLFCFYRKRQLWQKTKSKSGVVFFLRGFSFVSQCTHVGCAAQNGLNLIYYLNQNLSKTFYK